ncbi:3-dehydroquinate synthase [Candidatus Vidania fulgoroideorum]
MRIKNKKIIFIKKVNNIIEFINNKSSNNFFVIDKKVYDKYKIVRNSPFYIIKKGEKEKKIKIVEKIIELMLKNNCNKKTTLISFGGGVTGDISGFISSIFLRGISYINVPTTVLSQIDSSIGGKNGVNSLCAKNMIGTIRNPDFILISTEFLKTLKKSVYKDGFSEIIKISLINNKKLFNIILKKYNQIIKFKILKIFKRSIISKLLIVRKDFNDKNYRFLLNLGHTFGHSIERFFNYKISHGKSVYIGIYLISYYSYYIKELNKYNLNKIINIIKIYFNNIKFYLKKLSAKKIMNNIHYDKKKSDNNHVKIVVIKNIGDVFLIKTKFKKIYIFLKKFFKRIS